MVQTLSSMMPLGTHAPDFSLLEVVSGESLSLSALKGKHATLIMFICNHCPFVKHIQEELVKLGKVYPQEGVGLIAISSNDVDEYPDDSPENMKILAETLGYDFPYLYDEDQSVAKAYGATCTPDFFIFDKGLKCVYRGQLDDSRPGNNIPLSGADIRKALNAMLSGNEINSQQKPSVGCNIKWKQK